MMVKGGVNLSVQLALCYRMAFNDGVIARSENSESESSISQSKDNCREKFARIFFCMQFSMWLLEKFYGDVTYKQRGGPSFWQLIRLWRHTSHTASACHRMQVMFVEQSACSS